MRQLLIIIIIFIVWLVYKWLNNSSRSSPPYEKKLSPSETIQLNIKNAQEARIKEAQKELQKQALHAANERKERAKDEIKKGLFDRNKDLIEKFLQIAERKVSIIDDYGDENWEVLPTEILTCLKKIAHRENKDIDWKDYVKYSILPDEYKWLRDKLENAFHTYHAEHQTRLTTRDDLSTMTGIEFESWVVKLLKENGVDDVRGTPATGDQGADIIANIGSRHIIIQAKRHKGTVGNKAVQEAIGALHYYGGNEGWVITSSTFTPSAVALAQKSKIILIDGKALAHIEDFINHET